MEIKLEKKKRNLTEIHRYYKITGFYDFLFLNIKKSIFPFIIIVSVLLIINYKLISIIEIIENLTRNVNDTNVLFIFFISESFLGLIPTDIFIAWSKTTTTPLLNLFFLSIISYSGGILSYFIGKYLLKFEKIKKIIEVKFVNYIKYIKKWGGLIIAVGALLPLSFSISILIAGLVSYSFRKTLLFATLIFLRFVIYGAVIYNVF
jgi:membrane protein YqaA with SNARE-associated domain